MARIPVRRWVVALAALAVGALVLRLLNISELQRSPFFSVLIVDGERYDAWAQQIVSGQWLGTDVFYQTPLYPYLLALLYKLAGHQVLLVRLVQAVAGAGSCVLLALAGRSFFNARVGLIAGCLLAIWPEAIFWDGLLQKSSLDLLCMTALLALIGVCVSKPRLSVLAAIGVVGGAFMLNRENARVLYPVIIVWLFLAFRSTPFSRRLGWAAIVSIGFALVVLPVAIRNYAVGGEFLVSTSQLGPNFYIGNHRGASGMYDPLVPDHGNPLDEREDATRLAEQVAGRSVSPATVSSYWFRRALAEIGQQPASWVRLLGRKMLLTFSAGELVDSESLREYAEYSTVLRALRWFDLGIVLPLAGLGIYLTRSHWKSLGILYAMLAALELTLIAFYVVSRYRFPLTPILLLFAAAALGTLTRARTEGRQWWPGLIAAAALAIVSHIVPIAAAPNTTHDNVGAALVRSDRADEAVPVLQRAVALAPDDARAHYDLGVAFERTGASQRALGEFRTAVRLRSDFVEAQDALGAALRSAGQTAEAVGHFAEAVRLRPSAAPQHLNYGVVLWESGSADAAIAEFERALSLKPDYAEAHGNLAAALAATGRTDEAIAHFREAVRLQPDNFGTHANFGDLLRRVHRTAEAIQEYREAERLAPQNPDTRLTLLGQLAQAYADANQTRDVIDTLTRALALARSTGRDALAARLSEALRTSGR